ncbi:MAG: c-type cytochrome domain-containing protein [Pirellulaceae bacterium]|nr:c-type cytochrome domain-containing protein [Pirellulaceae bacterium]
MLLSRFSFVAAAFAALLPGMLVPASLVAADAIAIAEVKHDGDVDFEKEILPIFRRNCLACHSATEAESDLVLESPQAILKGGSEGPSVIAGKGAESLLLKLAAKQKEPYMPPPDNDVKAKALTPQELGLIKLWIDQGATGEVKGAANISWQPLPPGINPIYAVAITPDGQYAAAARANQIFLYHVPSKRELGRLTDPSLIERGIYKQPGVADLDLVQSLKFSPDGQWLASGGFRTVKIWQKPAGGKKLDLAALEGPARSLAISADGKLAAIGEETGKVKVYTVADGKVSKTLTGHSGPVTGVAFTADGAKLVTGSQDKTVRVFNLADQAQVASIETPSPVNAVAIVAEGKQIATGGADNIIRTWELPAAQPADAPKPIKELTGHGGPITSLAAIGPTGAQLLSGSKDNSVRTWDVVAGTALKNMAHGTPVEGVAARADGKRFASISSANNIKLWNGDDNKQIAEMKGDLRATIKVGDLTRVVSLAKKQVDLAKADLKEAGDRKKAEEDNQKKSAEALTKADGDFKIKDEAAKKPTEEKTAADKVLADAMAAKTKADETKKTSDEAFTKADEAQKKAKSDADAAAKAATEADKVAKAAADKMAKAKEAADKDAANEELKKALAAAEAELKDADAKKKTADDAKTAADKTLVDADAARKSAETAKQASDKAATDAMTAFTQADQKVKQLMPTYQKAVDERTAAERTLQTAQRAVERAAEAVKKATEAIPGFEKTVAQREEEVKKHEADLATATTAAKDAEKPLKGVAFSPDGKLLATVGDDQLLHTWDAETGAAVEVYAGAGAALNVVAFTADNAVITAAANNTGATWDFATEWKLVRTIGSPDMADVLVDRVTALDFSADGKVLAVGGGEPSRSGEIKLFNVADGKLVLAVKEPHSDTVNCLDFSPDGAQIASCAADRFVKVWNVADGKFVRSFEGHTHHVLGVSWRADGRMLVSCGADNVVKVWDTRTGDQLRTVQNQFTKEVTSIAFVADGDICLATSGDSKVKQLNAANGGNVRDFSGTADYMYCGAASADGKTIVAGGLDGVLRIWNDQGQPQAQFAPPAPAPTTQTAAK